MEQNTAKLIEQLAEKLGTTTEYLWSVLIKQAPIEGWIQIFQTIVICLFGWMLHRLHKKFSAKIVSDDRWNNDDMYGKYETNLTVPMFLGICVFLFCFLVAFFSLPSLFSALFNPEYWALKEVLNTVQNSK